MNILETKKLTKHFKMNKSQKIWVGAMVVIVAIFVGWQWQRAKQANNGTIKIGAVLPLTGDFAFAGEDMRHGMEMAIKEHPEFKGEIVYEDDASFSHTAAVNAANKLIDADNVDVTLGSVMDLAKVLGPIWNAKKVPGIIIWDSNQTIATLGDYVFGMGESTEAAAQKMVNFSYKNLDVKHIAIVSSLDDWSELISSNFIADFQKIGGVIDSHDRVNLESSDLKTVVAKIKANGSQAIYFPIYSQALYALVKQSRDLGYKGYLLSADAFGEADAKNLGTYAQGLYLTNAVLEDPSFLQKYKNTYGETVRPSDLLLVGLGYDSANLLIAVISDLEAKNIPVTRESIRSHLIGFEWNGVTGKSIFSTDRTANKTESILKVDNGGFITVIK